MDNILLSIIIPAYNSGKFLSNTLSSLISQDLSFCEIIIINDGSTDNTEKICKEFAGRCKEIRYISQKNQGVSIARNAGIEEANGKYIYFFDSDDALTADSLSFFRATLNSLPENTPVFAFGYEMRRNGVLVKNYVKKSLDGKLFASRELQEIFFSKKLSCHICSCIYGKNFILKNKILFTPNVKIGEDVEFIIKAVCCANSLYYSKRICFIYQLRDDSTMKGYSTYSINRLHSFELLRDCVLRLKSSIICSENKLNFFVANLYASNLFAYLNSDLKNRYINNKFLQNKKVLSCFISGKFLNWCGICILRYVPIKILFVLFGKY
ncbi:glycosyltransferase family 2 protein [Treponema pedis]|uniref:Glycosyltransferase n=1 Tax=Treponema pedis TaxID=409322 RepID=A0A7S6WR70_9SPIR|nr:glycosyltransferase [Treponema pedis]QOW61722.1 glycosyltransferase [Treponema pedis]